MAAKKAEARQRRKRRRKSGGFNRSFRRIATPLRFVEHPRYGASPIISGQNWTEAEVLRSYWLYRHMTWDPKIIYPETAIRAETACQNIQDFARWLYVDIARKCRSCRRWFLFYALEQRYWYETLGFNINADCVHCHECRRAGQIEKSIQHRYDELMVQTEKTPNEWAELSKLADQLFDTGYITKPETLLKSRMPKRLRKAVQA